jgi:hypothetical protein
MPARRKVEVADIPQMDRKKAWFPPDFGHISNNWKN